MKLYNVLNSLLLIKLGTPGTSGSAGYPGSSFGQKPNYQSVKPSSSYPGSPGMDN